MSSGRFVSGGTIDQPIERDDEWHKAQQELEAQRRTKEAASHDNDGKSLYEVLQANKAKKQEAFEESIKLKNQFRALDEDEAEFLDSVLESTRAKDAALKKETTEQLDAFRRQQDEAERQARLAGNTEGDLPVEEEQWVSAGRKRKKNRDKDALIGVKIRRTSSTGEKGSSSNSTPKPDTTQSARAGEESEPATTPDTFAKQEPAAKAPTKSESLKDTGSASRQEAPAQKPKPTPAALGLSGYSSDEDD